MRLLPFLALIPLLRLGPRPPQEPPRSRADAARERISSMDQSPGKRASAREAKLELDAFVSTRLAAAVADLEDFRTAAAIAKARGRVEEARMRCQPDERRRILGSDRS